MVCVCGDKPMLRRFDASFSFLGSHVSFCTPRTHNKSRVVSISMAVKRSPKRLKYASPTRFNKVFPSLFPFPFAVVQLIKLVRHRVGLIDNINNDHQEDGLLYIEADPSASNSWKLEPVVNLLKQGAVGVIPTDTL